MIGVMAQATMPQLTPIHVTAPGQTCCGSGPQPTAAAFKCIASIRISGSMLRGVLGAFYKLRTTTEKRARGREEDKESRLFCFLLSWVVQKQCFYFQYFPHARGSSKLTCLPLLACELHVKVSVCTGMYRPFAVFAYKKMVLCKYDAVGC